ncbi:MAG: RnfABCDGE type electron transport complex subunit B [Clostridiaceae bacterium]|nr:RnfABCDGE type electron transport complex subunit B [Clostridiaceae bacterium]
MTEVLIAAAIIGATGLVIAILLGIAAIQFSVPVDEKEVAVRGELPGNNCGGCGYAGCDALAKAIAAGEAPVNACPVGGAAAAEKIGSIMGVEAGDAVRMVAFVKCAGTCDKADIKANYFGISDCRSAAAIPGKGDKACAYGCLGFGSCVAACQFDAIHVQQGIAVVDQEKCVACGKCIQQCPNALIELVPYDAKYAVRCSNQDKGPKVMAVCDVGCIGCGICAKQCEFDAVTVENNIAHIDQSKCTGCGKCAEKCPKKIIMAQ